MELPSRMKKYESCYDSVLLDRLPIIARVDGSHFHTYTKGCERPFDAKLHGDMVETVSFLIKEFHAKIAYSQSDEMSFLFYQDDIKSQTIFGGRVNKINSILASAAAAKFNTLRPVKLAYFDARCYVLPSKDEVCNYFLWRELDASRNSVSMLAQAHFGHKELHGKDSSMMQEMLWAKKTINWNDCPANQKRGSWVAKRSYMKGEATRHRVEVLDVPPFSKIMNKTQFLFEGAEPCLEPTI